MKKTIAESLERLATILECGFGMPESSPAPSTGQMQQVMESLTSLHEKVNRIMSSQAEVTALLGQMNTATNQVADRLTIQTRTIQQLRDQLAATGSISPEEQAALDATVAALNVEISRLNAMASDPANPVPPVDNPPVPSNG